MKKRLLAALLSAVLLTTGTLPALAEEDSNTVETDVIVVEDSETEETESSSEAETIDEAEPKSEESADDVQTIDVGEDEETALIETDYVVNPLYADVIDESDLLEPQDAPASSGRRSSVPGIDTYTDDYEVVAQLIREGMRDHTETVALQVIVSDYTGTAIAKQWITQAMEETESPIEGDYLRWNYAGFATKAEGSLDKTTNTFTGTYTITFTYYTTPEQEAALKTAVDEQLSAFGFTDTTSDYTKLYTIYDYVCRHVTYDNANLNNTDYKLKYTAYAAMINGTAVCQGYAALIYRMAKQEGINTRIIASATHGWNIVQLKGAYYYVDATWDSNTPWDSNPPDAWRYFLCGEQCKTFFASSSHTRSDGSDTENSDMALDYTSADFYAAYPMAEEDYDIFCWTQEGDQNYTCVADVGEEKITCEVTITQSKQATCTQDGFVTCTAEGEWNGTPLHSEKKWTIPATGHAYGGWETTKEATCTEAGSKQRVCANDETHIDTQEIPATGHAYGEWETTKEATCTEAGSKQRICANDETHIDTQEIPATGHAYGEWETTKEATCTEAGSKQRICANDETHIDTQEIPATGHAYGKPTFTWTGTDSCKAAFLCGNCEKTQTVACTITAKTTAATCTTDGKTVYTATASLEGASGTDTKTETIAAKGHTSDGGTVIWDPTCRLAGMRRYVCTKCGEKIKEQTIPATKKHTYKTVITKAKPGKNGKIVETCSVCEDVKSTTTISAPKTITLSKTSYIYDKKTKKPTVTVKDAAGKTIAASYYTVSYASGRKNVGSYKVTVTLKGAYYSGSLSTTFQITAKNISGLTATLSPTNTYSGAAKKPTVTLKNGSIKLKSGTSYTVKYTNNKNVGKATATITGKGNYTGTKKLTFQIKPKATTLKSVAAAKKGFTAKWTKQATQTTGYQIQYATNSKFTSGAKTVTVSKNKTVSKKITKLKAKKKYYVRIRTYKTVSGKKYYSSWSKAKTVTTKK